MRDNEGHFNRSRPRHPGRLLSFCLAIDGSAAAVFPRLGSSMPFGCARGATGELQRVRWLGVSQLGNQIQEVVPPWIKTRATAGKGRVRAARHRRTSGWPPCSTLTISGVHRIRTVTYTRGGVHVGALRSLIARL